jgi:hypothetical protein
MSISFKVLKFFTMSPSVNYEEKWYGEKIIWGEKILDDDTVASIVKLGTQKGFNRISNYSFGTSLNTRIYGIYFFKRGKVKAIRHIINPSISLNYTPDFTGNKNYFTKFTDPTNSARTIVKANHEGYVYGASNTGRSGSVGLGVTNNLEMKVQGKDDSVARKVMLLNNLSFNTSYNLIADSFNLAPISIAANTNILDNTLNMNLSASLDPYNYVPILKEGVKTGKERRVDQLAWKSQHLGRITSATLAMSTNLNPKARSKATSSREKIGKSDMPDQEKQFLIQHPDAYVDFDIPWSLNMSYNLNYSHAISQKPSVTQSLTANGDLSLSEKWMITYSTGYHFESKQFTTSSFGISRDLHCWTMNFNWTPFGYYQSYYLTIRVKASVLQDLKLERRKPFFDNL